MVDQIVDQPDQRLLVGSPAGGIGRAVHDRGGLGVAETDALAEQRDMHAPFVFAAQPRRGAIDQDLALAQAERAFVEVAAGEDLGEDARALRQGAEQQQRIDGGRHDARELGGDGGLVGWRGGGDTGHATVYVATSFLARYRKWSN